MEDGTLAELLSKENDLQEYISLLSKAAKKYCIFIVSSDTPCGSQHFTHALASQLCRALGTKTLLHDKMRCAYLLAMNKGEILAESVGQNSPLVFDYVLNNTPISLKSEPFRNDRNIKSYIKINGIDYMPLGVHYKNRGLNIVVFDMECCKEIDRVNFDTYERISASARTSLKVQDFDDFYAQHQNVVFIYHINPVFPAHSHSENEKYILENNVSRTSILEQADKPISVLSEYIPDAEGIREVLSPPPAYISTNGAKMFFDMQGRYVNTVNGHRITVGQPEYPKRSIWFLGGCGVFGVGCRDEGTVQSFLQFFLNEYAPEHSFIVHNYGHYLWNNDDQSSLFPLLRTLPIKPGDIVFNAPLSNSVAILDCTSLGTRPHNWGELFWDRWHFTEKGQLLVAKAIFDALQEHDYFSNYVNTETTEKPQITQDAQDTGRQDFGFSSEQLDMLDSYKAILNSFYEQYFNNFTATPVVGAIVMNCNPFTLGHRYLIEHASKKVDLLVVFVVQEDKSFFPFEDRMDLVDKGTEDIENVAVIESGSFIISSLTFKEYFNKSEIQDRIIDSSQDVTIFAKEIAPAMNISVRFVGSEPFDRITKQYNDMLSVILPRYGIHYEEIPRLEQDGEAVSASKVRELLSKGDWEGIERLVPKTTLDYLSEKFK